jgi:hypothetical protein
MPTAKIKEYTYKGFPIQIDFATGNDWGDYKNKFYSVTPLPFCISAKKEIEDLESLIKIGIDNWLSIQPKTNQDWVELVESCLIQDGYESWHVDERRIMNVLERYANLKGKK